ncbi:hypothetical protein TWF281_011352 [Arthrobotrys megalospora]
MDSTSRNKIPRTNTSLRNSLLRWILSLPFRFLFIALLVFQLYGIIFLMDWGFWILSPPEHSYGKPRPFFKTTLDHIISTIALLFCVYSIVITGVWTILIFFNVHWKVEGWMVVAQGIRDIPIFVMGLAVLKMPNSIWEWDEGSGGSVLWAFISIATFSFVLKEYLMKGKDSEEMIRNKMEW